MRLFQNSGLYPSYLRRLNQLASRAHSFDERRQIFLTDRFGALHFLKPVLEGNSDAFFTNGDDETLQRHWARESPLSQWVDKLLSRQIPAFSEMVDEKKLERKIRSLTAAKAWDWDSVGRVWPYLNLKWTLSQNVPR